MHATVGFVGPHVLHRSAAGRALGQRCGGIMDRVSMESIRRSDRDLHSPRESNAKRDALMDGLELQTVTARGAGASVKRQASRAEAYKIVTSRCTVYREDTIVARYGYDTNTGMSTVTVMHGEGIGSR